MRDRQWIFRRLTLLLFGFATSTFATNFREAVDFDCSTGCFFAPPFDAANVHTQSWGELTFTFADCNHGHVDWSSTIPGYGSGGMDLTRLTEPAGVTCPWRPPRASA
jgi:hypothetical protein